MPSLSTQLHVLYTPRGIPITLTHTSKTYLLAFPLHTLAKRTQRLLTPATVPKMYLTRHLSPPSNQDTDPVLFEMGLDPRTYHIPYAYTDAEAFLHIPRRDPLRPTAETRTEPKPVFRCVERSMVDVILYPFVKNVGLLLPLGVVEETPDELVLESQMVNPSANLDLFRNHLETSLQ